MKKFFKTIATVFVALIVLGAIGNLAGCSAKDDSDRKASQHSSEAAQSNSKNSDSTNEPSTTEKESWEITYQNCRLRESLIGKEAFYSAIVEIENTGISDLYLKDATFDFEDKSGHLLETYSFVSADPSIIAAGEKGYFYAEGSLEKVGMDTEYVFVPTIKVEGSKNSIIRYEISDTSMENTSDGGVTITGRVKNTTEDEASLVWVSFILYRADGTPITAGGTNITDLGSGERASFSRTFYPSDLGVDASEVASYKVYSEKMQIQF